MVTETAPTAPQEPLTDPRARDWDETPAEAARADDRYWDDYEYDRDED